VKERRQSGQVEWRVPTVPTGAQPAGMNRDQLAALRPHPFLTVQM
jgi:hypothetical protein